MRRPWASGQLGVENGQPFERGDVAEPLIGADEVIEGGPAMEMQGDGQLEGIESANLPGESVACDQVLGAVVMRVEEANNLISPPGDLGREEPPQTGEFSGVERSGSDLDGEGRDGLDQRHPGD